MCKFGRNPAICPREEATFVPSYHVTFDIDVDLEHTLDACSPGDEEEAIFVQSYKSCALTLTLSTPWMHAHLEIIGCKFGRNRAICLREESIFVLSQKCPYHVTFDLDLDLEHILDARSPGVSSGASLVAIEPFDHEKKRLSCHHKSARIT